MRGRISLTLALVLLTCSPIYGQEAFTVSAKPVAAPEVVELGIELPDQIARVTVIIGQMARYKKGDLYLGLTPVRRDSGLAVQVFVIKNIDVGDGKVHETLKWIETVDLIDDRAFPKSGPPIHLLGTMALEPEEKSLLSSKAKPSRCCVTCGEDTACGCAVEMSCGSCCVDPCCGAL